MSRELASIPGNKMETAKNSSLKMVILLAFFIIASGLKQTIEFLKNRILLIFCNRWSIIWHVALSFLFLCSYIVFVYLQICAWNQKQWNSLMMRIKLLLVYIVVTNNVHALIIATVVDKTQSVLHFICVDIISPIVFHTHIVIVLLGQFLVE